MNPIFDNQNPLPNRSHDAVFSSLKLKHAALALRLAASFFCLSILHGCGGGEATASPPPKVEPTPTQVATLPSTFVGTANPSQTFYPDCPDLYELPSLAKASEALAAIDAGLFYMATDRQICAVFINHPGQSGSPCQSLAMAPTYESCAASSKPNNPYIFRLATEWSQNHKQPPAWPAAPGFEKSPYLALNLADARSMMDRGIEAIVPMPGIHDIYKKSLLPDFQSRIAKVIMDNPDIYQRKNIQIEIVDEIFMDGLGQTQDASDSERSMSDAIAARLAIKAIIPHAKVGVVFAPVVFQDNPKLMSRAQQLASQMDWVGLDPYLGTLGSHEIAAKISLTKEFASAMAQYAPHTQRVLFIQGFAPPYSSNSPLSWTQNQKHAFGGFIADIAKIGRELFHVSSVWGWGYEGGGSTPGVRFPTELRASYTSGSTPPAGPDTPADPATRFKFPLGKSSLAGSFHEPNSLSLQPFASGSDIGEALVYPDPTYPGGKRYDYSATRFAIEQGHDPMTSLNFLLDPQRRLLPHSFDLLDRIIDDNPEIFNHPKLILNVIDEVFWRGSYVANAEDRRAEVATFKAIVSHLRAKIPKARLGFSVTPFVWDPEWQGRGSDAIVLEDIAALLPVVDGVAADPYFWSPSEQNAMRAANNATAFANFLDQRAPKRILRILVLQGFGPLDFPREPHLWSEKQIASFNNASAPLFEIARKRYDVAMIWGFGQTKLVKGQSCPDPTQYCVFDWNDGTQLPDEVKLMFTREAEAWNADPTKK